ncbi:hypothetical protein ANO14919_051760 [Xylariales sp. No.14919]|nr:hypothetical protein ANO14919_051760 [Xylariales sp. No.14919]
MSEFVFDHPLHFSLYRPRSHDRIVTRLLIVHGDLQIYYELLRGKLHQWCPWYVIEFLSDRGLDHQALGSRDGQTAPIIEEFIPPNATVGTIETLLPHCCNINEPIPSQGGRYAYTVLQCLVKENASSEAIESLIKGEAKVNAVGRDLEFQSTALNEA